MYLAVCLFLFLRATSNSRESETSLSGNWLNAKSLGVFPLLLITSGFDLILSTHEGIFLDVQQRSNRTWTKNHLVVPSNLQLTDWQSDLVEITRFDRARLRQIRSNSQQLPYLDLRRRRQQPDLRVTFKRNGIVENYDGARPETYSALPELGWFSSHYFYFRAVDLKPSQVRCKH